MSRPLVAVTGASGKTGGAVVALLRQRDVPVRALVRARDARSAALERAGAEVAVADLFDPEQLTAALAGARRAYYVPPFHPNMIHSASAFAAAARAAGIEVIVGMSQWLASPSHPSVLTRHHWLADERFRTLPGVGYVKLEPGYFADNTLRFIDFAAHLGFLPNLVGASRNAPPSIDDIARVAAAALIDPDPHVGRSYRPTGPRLLSTGDIADVLTRVLGRTVRPMTLPTWLFLKAARQQGVPLFDVANLLYYVQDHAQGAFEHGAPTSHVADVTGRPAEDFEVTARRYAALPIARRSLGRTVRAWVDFLRTPLSRGYDPVAYAQSLALPQPAQPRLAMDDAGWRAAHAG